MSASDIFLIAISGLGVVHGLFLATILWVYKKGNQHSNRILSLLLIVLSFRIGKSVFLEFGEHLDVKMIFIGLGSLMIIGPLFYFYTHALVNKDFRIRNLHLLHFVPAFLGVCFGFWIREEHLETLPMLFFLFLFASYYGHYLGYIITSYSFLTKQRKAGLNTDTFNFLRLLILGLFVIWIAYVLNLFDEMIPYVVGPVLYSLVAYVISLIVIQKGYLLKLDYTKYRTTHLSEDQMGQLFSKVENLVFTSKQFRNANLTLKSLSQDLNVTPQVLSMVINQKSEMNFNSYLNQYRIQESIQRFSDPLYHNHTIAAIAFDVGFNSISSYNSAFKKKTGKTPQAYREQLMK